MINLYFQTCDSPDPRALPPRSAAICFAPDFDSTVYVFERMSNILDLWTDGLSLQALVVADSNDLSFKCVDKVNPGLLDGKLFLISDGLMLY